jgi:catechol 2,3-dioxygenase-like lactoylglutathione lyase family enzyme
MLDKAELIAFAATTDAAAAQRFYEGVLGLACVEDTPFALVLRARNAELRLQKLAAFTPAAHTMLGWTVPDIEATVAALRAKGVRCERFDGLPQDEAGIWPSPSGAKIAWFKDPDGNLLSLTEPPHPR